MTPSQIIVLYVVLGAFTAALFWWKSNISKSDWSVKIILTIVTAIYWPFFLAALICSRFIDRDN